MKTETLNKFVAPLIEVRTKEKLTASREEAEQQFLDKDTKYRATNKLGILEGSYKTPSQKEAWIIRHEDGTRAAYWESEFERLPPTAA